ncbi:MAG TPA: tetraacyldisaccharide 4'-kinase [Thiolapillus brandeum]|uniref:Tetraacyldisaccharide 4'-kinase n=1 Tax=Thiolapillus brandeum TaxID=1076588 RepID=A0A831NW81_9GAMM|nr:tetraacyldisaccharide 4'-kinase [Thiolapillus brandeum]
MNSIWYGNNLLRYLLLPLSVIFWLVSGFRRLLFVLRLRKIHRFPVPVIVVGNITVGGTGKTPLVVWLSKHLQSLGYRPGIVARGYGGKASHWPQQVRADSDPVMVGDEAVLLARLSGCPVCVAPKRADAVQELLKYTQCNIVLSDDGLQHYAMGRDMEIVVIDGQRGLGNGYLLPAGPLRELPGRLRRADLLISNGPWQEDVPVMNIEEPQLLPLLDLSTQPHPLSQAADETVHAVAGTGNPQRFFAMLERHGLKVIPHAFPDHHGYSRGELQFDDDLPVLMTEKDAVKYARFAGNKHWLVRIGVVPDDKFVTKLDELLQGLKHGQEVT